MKGRQQPLPLREAWIICFILGVVMLNFPFLHIFNKTQMVLGVPLFILYIMVGWPLSIAVIYLFSVYLGKESDGSKASKHPDREGRP